MLCYNHSYGAEAHSWCSVPASASELQNLFVMLKPAPKRVHVDKINMRKLFITYCILALK